MYAAIAHLLKHQDIMKALQELEWFWLPWGWQCERVFSWIRTSSSEFVTCTLLLLYACSLVSIISCSACMGYAFKGMQSMCTRFMGRSRKLMCVLEYFDSSRLKNTCSFIR